MSEQSKRPMVNVGTKGHCDHGINPMKAAFESWYDNDIDEPLPTDYTIMGKRYLYMGWNAATAEANKRIAELTQDRNDLNYLCMERLHKIESLEGTVTRLRARLIAEKELLYDQIKIDMKTSRENEQLKVKNSELESEVAELKERIETHIAINKSLLMQRDELQADNKRLREGVAIIKNSSDDLNTITQLQANNHALREALIVCKQYITEAIIDDKYHEASCGLDELYLLRDKAINLYNAAISAPRE